MPKLHPSFRVRLPFIIAGFLSFLFSVWLYFVKDETSAGIFVGLCATTLLIFSNRFHRHADNAPLPARSDAPRGFQPKAFNAPSGQPPCRLKLP